MGETMSSGKARLQANTDVLARRVGNELVLVHLGTNRIYSLNETGGRLWELLSGGNTIAQALDQMRAEFDVSVETLQAEAASLISKLESEGLLERGTET